MLPFYIKSESDNQKNLKPCYKNTDVKIPFIPWMKILNAKLNFEIWSELTHEGFGTNVRSLYLSLYYKYVSIYPTTICNKGKFPTEEHR